MSNLDTVKEYADVFVPALTLATVFWGIYFGFHRFGLKRERFTFLNLDIRQPIIVTLRPTVFECYIAVFCEPDLGQALLKYGDIIVHRFGRCTAEKSNHRNRGLLRARRKRPHSSRATKNLDEIAPSHCLPPKAWDHADLR